jgi:hypothetical protein
MIVFLDDALTPNQAQTHALIVGVGEYQHLPGGTGSPAVPDFGLDQLTSTVVSASALADWLITKHRNPKAPLGSVNLLLSPAEYAPSDPAAERLRLPAGTKLTVDLARSDLIKSAFRDWFLKLNRASDNVGLFFFAGHGLEATQRYLVPADFGDDPVNPYARLLNFTQSHGHMDGCAAQTQLYLLDACREGPQELRDAAAKGSIGQELIGPQGGSAVRRDAPIFHSSVKGQQAGGDPGKVSYFTEALRECLNGMGARDASGPDCPVDHISLARAVMEYVDRMREEKNLPLGCDLTAIMQLPVAADVHMATAPVQVMTLIECLPAAAHTAATRLWIEDSAGVSHEAVDNPRPRRWRHKIPAGTCTVQATFFPGDRWVNFLLSGPAVPPLFNPTCVVIPRSP